MNFDLICFDCDSTLSKIEGIDELARRVGMGMEMARLTNQAMNGEVPLEAIYERRLSLIKPDRSAIDWLADLYIEHQVDGVREVFEALLKNGKQVHIISGGLRQAIIPLANKLGVPESNIHAVDIQFNANGSYHGFDSKSPLARNGGKAEICQQLRQHDEPMAMIGDGQTDLESQQAGATFIGFGGVVRRTAVEQQADHFISSESLVPVLDYLI
jgi:phosphoserine phosphatase